MLAVLTQCYGHQRPIGMQSSRADRVIEAAQAATERWPLAMREQLGAAGCATATCKDCPCPPPNSTRAPVMPASGQNKHSRGSQPSRIQATMRS